MRYSIEPRDRIYVKRYGFLSFAKNMGKSLTNKYSYYYYQIYSSISLSLSLSDSDFNSSSI